MVLKSGFSVPQQPDHLDVAMALGFQSAARPHAVEIAVDIELEQIARRVARTTRRLRLNPPETCCNEIEAIDEGVNEADGIVSANVIVHRFGQKQQLIARIADATTPVRSSAGQVTDAVTEAASQLGGVVRQAASALGGTASQAANSAADTITGASVAAMGRASQAATSFSQTTMSTGAALQKEGGKWSSSVRQNLSNLFDRQPLLLGAVGIAIGAGIAASVPLTQAENKAMGSAGELVRDKMAQKVGEIRQGADAVLQEARSQGLPPQADEAVRKLVEKIGSLVPSGDLSSP